MCLIRPSALNRDLRERQWRLEHHALRTLDAPSHYVGVRRFIQARTKSAAEMEFTQINQTGEFRRTDLGV
jgi:hypothetical protein